MIQHSEKYVQTSYQIFVIFKFWTYYEDKRRVIRGIGAILNIILVVKLNRVIRNGQNIIKGNMKQDYYKLGGFTPYVSILDENCYTNYDLQCIFIKN